MKGKARQSAPSLNPAQPAQVISWCSSWIDERSSRPTHVHTTCAWHTIGLTQQPHTSNCQAFCSQSSIPSVNLHCRDTLRCGARTPVCTDDQCPRRPCHRGSDAQHDTAHSLRKSGQLNAWCSILRNDACSTISIDSDLSPCCLLVLLPGNSGKLELLTLPAHGELELEACALPQACVLLLGWLCVSLCGWHAVLAVAVAPSCWPPAVAARSCQGWPG